MARLTTCGFETQSVLEMTNILGSGHTFVTGRAGIGVATGKAIQLGNGLGQCQIYFDPTSTLTEFYMSFALKITNAVSANVDRIFINDASGNNVLRMKFAIDGVVTYTLGASTVAGTGTHTISSTNFVLVEIYFKLSASVGVCNVSIDGASDLAFSGNTNPSSYGNVSRFMFGLPASHSGGNGSATLVDDLVINDTTTAADNTAPGDRRIVLLTPSGDGASSQFTGSDGNSVNNSLLVDEVPNNGDTDYVQDNTVGHKDTYAMSDLAALQAGDAIARVQVIGIAKRANAAVSGSIRGLVKSSTTTDNGPDVSLGTAYQVFRGTDLTTDPNTLAAWTATNVNAIEAGMEVRT